MSGERWATGLPCDAHGEPWCAGCKPSERSVFTVAGGSAYHVALDCEALRDGQEAVERRGGTTSPIVTVLLGTAKSQLRSPCQVCMPEG